MLAAGAFARAARAHEASGVGCQDAAVAEVAGRRAFAAVCDGCSSGEDSGLSAKLFARAALDRWRSGLPAGRELAERAWGAAGRACALAGLDASLSPATLLAASVEEGEDGAARATLTLWGDGAVAWMGGDGAMLGLWIGSSAGNMPAYPAYAFDEGLWEGFEGQGGSCAWEAVSPGIPRLDRTGRGWGGGWDLAPGQSLFLLSDGVMAVGSVEPQEAALALCSGRGPGEFWTRRARRAIDGWTKAGCALGDDVGLACVKALGAGEV